LGFFDIVSQTICLGWLQTVILLISASQVSRISGMSHWHLALILLIGEFNPFTFKVITGRGDLLLLFHYLFSA
jgi:hypothetical protein